MNRLPTVLCAAALIIAQAANAQFITAEITATNYDTLRVVSYNLLNYPNDNATRDPYLRRVVHTVKPDIQIVQEITSQAGVTAFLNNVLNYYQAGSYTTIAFHDGYDTDNHIYVKTGKATIVSAGYISTALRDIAEYVVRFTSSGDTVRLYSLHLKASTGYEDERLAEATILRNHLNSLPAGTKFMVMGDYNIYTSTEPAFQKLIGSEADNDGRCKDPINAVGAWNNNSAFRFIHTQSPRVRAFGGGSTGGMDDRFDIILTSYSSLDPSTIVSSYKAYGNDGNHFNDSINRLPNSAVPDSVAHGLHYGSDHIPVACDFKFEKSVLAFQLISPPDLSVNQGLSGTLRWHSSANATAYDLYFDQNNPPTTIVSPNQTDTSFAYNGLVQGNLYYWRVVAKNGSKTLASGSWNFTTLAMDPPGAFELSSPGADSTGLPLNGQLSWQTSANALSYDVYLDTANPPVIRIDSNLSSIFYDYSGLDGNTNYYWKVVAKNLAGSLVSLNSPKKFTTASPPAPATSLILSAPEPGTINLSWTDNAPDETGYHIYRSESFNGSYVQVGGDLPPNTASFSDSLLGANTRYYYKVSPYNEIGESEPATADKATLAGLPGAPVIGDLRPHSLHLTLSADYNPVETEYLVRFVHDADTSYLDGGGSLGASQEWNTKGILGDSSGLSVTGLDSCVSYSISLKARNLESVETAYTPAEIGQLPCYLFSGSVAAGWNLISMPLIADDNSRQTLFPSSISSAYFYNGAYVASESLQVGVGYWLKYGSVASVELAGTPVYDDTIDLIEGWNLIGSVAVPVAVSLLTTDPPGVSLSNFFEYQGAYIISITLEPLRAYWIKAGAPCKLIIGGSSLNPK